MRCVLAVCMNIFLLSLPLIAVCIALYLLFRRLRDEQVASSALRESLEAMRCQLSAQTATADAQTTQLHEQRERREAVERELQGCRAAHEQAVLTLQREYVLKLTTLADCKSVVEQRVAALQSTLEARERELSEVRQQNNAQYRELEKLRADALAAAECEARTSTKLIEAERSAAEKMEIVKEAHAKLLSEFNGVAAQALERNTEKFETQTKTRLGEMSEALRTQVKELREKIELTHDQDARDRIALRTELQHIVETSTKLDKDAADLSRALTGEGRTQGAWGELVLSRVLELCGLREGIEYQTQVTLIDDEKHRLRPDVVVHLPGKRSVVVDSKVSLTAYNDYARANSTDEAIVALHKHVASIRNHIKQLSDKEYWRLNELKSADYVLMFIPIESSFADAIRHEPSLYDEAYKQRVILITPSTLLATLRTIEHTWRVERQNETARLIVDRASKLYDKFEAFVENLQDVGRRLEQAQASYGKAFSKLSQGSGNLVSQVQRLRVAGVKVRQELAADLVELAVQSDDHTVLEPASEPALSA